MSYKNKISKEDQLEAEIITHLNSISRIGQQTRSEGKRIGVASKYIYSIKTYEAYKESIERLVAYCLEHHPEIKHVSDCEEYVPEYIQHIIQEAYSSYTQKSRLSGFRKYFDNRFEDVFTESRKRSQIRRGRQDTLNAREFNKEAHSEIIWVLQHIGLRRREAESLHGSCVSLHEDGNYYIDGVKGKGGKIRDVRILDNDQTVIDLINGTDKDKLVFGRLHSKLNVHGLRADYAQALYKSVARDVETLDKKEVFVCRGDMAGIALDKKGMMIVSKSLGHNRINIISNNYLYGLKK